MRDAEQLAQSLNTDTVVIEFLREQFNLSDEQIIKNIENAGPSAQIIEDVFIKINDLDISHFWWGDYRYYRNNKANN